MVEKEEKEEEVAVGVGEGEGEEEIEAIVEVEVEEFVIVFVVFASSLKDKTGPDLGELRLEKPSAPPEEERDKDGVEEGEGVGERGLNM